MSEDRSSTGSVGEAGQPDLSPLDGERACVVCGGSMVGQRADALHCSPPCRAEAYRLRCILAGAPGQRYRSVADRMKARRRTV